LLAISASLVDMFPETLRDSVSVKVPSEHRAVDASRRTREMARWSGKHGCWSWLNFEKPNLNSGRATQASTVRGQHIRCVTPLHHGGGDTAGITSVDPCAIDALAKNRLPIHFHEADSPGRSSRSPMPGWRYTPVSRFGNTSFSAKPSQLLGSGGRH
jgi:hypothetical protein